jgi:endonuclease/exonuclease/phosphatase family metal-dependent hydrolase
MSIFFKKSGYEFNKLRMKYLLIFALTAWGNWLFASKPAEVAAFLQCVPMTPPAVNHLVTETIEKIETSLTHIQELNKEEKSFDSVIRSWDESGKEYFATIALLHSLGLVSQNPQLMQAGIEGSERLLSYITEKFQEPSTIEPFISYIEWSVKTKTATPSELYYYKKFVEIDPSSLSKELQYRIRQLKEYLNHQESLPYTFFRGQALPKENQGEGFSLLTWNLCFLPEPISLIFGGIYPWKHRIDGIIHILKSTKPDVICLQEIFQEKAAYQLIDALKEQYAFFYFNIAPKNFALNRHSIGLGSGLFIASKYALKSPYWKKFDHVLMNGLERGYFSFEVNNNDKKTIIFTTHLESSLPGIEAEQIRAEQLQEIISAMEKKSSSPVVLCGDLNIYLGTSEPAEKILRRKFYDPFNQDLQEVSSVNCTYCDYTGYLWPDYFLNSKRNSDFPLLSILDYTLIFKNYSGEEEHLIPSKKIIRAGNHYSPESALSDHHGLLTTILWD